MKRSNVYLMDILEEWNGENEREVIFEEVMIETLWELIKTREWLESERHFKQDK